MSSQPVPFSPSCCVFVVTATVNCQALGEITSFSETWQRGVG